MANTISSPRAIALQHEVQEGVHKASLRFLCLTVFLLMSAPRFRLVIFSVPLYVIDLLILATLLYAMRIEQSRRPPLRAIVGFILVAAVISELTAGIRMGTLLQPLYVIGRSVLAGSLFFSVPRIIRNKSDLYVVLRAALLGALITALLMIMTSLSMTRGFALKYVFSHSFLEPSSDAVLRHYGYRYEDSGGRGRSLIGVSILSAAFLNTIWPLLFLLRADKSLSRLYRAILGSAALLIPVGVVMSYSRGAIIGLLLIIIMALFFNSSGVRRPIILGVGVALIIFSSVGWNSDYFYFERITSTVERVFQDPYNNVSFTERLFAYSEPFEHLVENPVFLLVGEGFARENVTGHNLQAGWGTAATHAVFAAAYYGYGMLAAFAYMLLMWRGLRITWGYARRLRDGFATAYSQAMFAGLMGFLSWFLLGHAAVSQPRGAMFLFLVFGLVATQSNFITAPELSESDEDVTRE